MKIRSLLCAVLLAALFATGCGSDSEPESTSGVATTVSGDTTTTPTTPPSDSNDDAGDETEDADPLDTAALGAMCEDFALAMQQAVTASAGANAGNSDIEDSIAYLRAFADASPKEIKADITLVYEGYARIAEALVESGYDPSSGKQPTAAQIAALQGASQALANKDFTDASTRVSAWIAKGCTN